MSISYEEGLRMARLMKKYDLTIRKAILECQRLQHGVVALKFSNGCREMEIEILDLPFEENVRVYHE